MKRVELIEPLCNAWKLWRFWWVNVGQAIMASSKSTKKILIKFKYGLSIFSLDVTIQSCQEKSKNNRIVRYEEDLCSDDSQSHMEKFPLVWTVFSYILHIATVCYTCIYFIWIEKSQWPTGEQPVNWNRIFQHNISIYARTYNIQIWLLLLLFSVGNYISHFAFHRLNVGTKICNKTARKCERYKMCSQ